MKILKTKNELRRQIKKWKEQGHSIGFVPTMGFLHEGHQSLILRSVEDNDKTVVSIFVNPTQFGPNEDFGSYPREPDRDANLCGNAGADIIFHPEAEEMYDKNFSTYVGINNLGDELCGKSRPTHFSGVCTIVSKLFHIVAPDNAYFSQKDAQQLAIIRRMVKDLDMDIRIIGCPIIREADGLAKSSRNTYLNQQERQAALVLNRALLLGQQLILDGERNTARLIRAMTDKVRAEPLAEIDYIEIVDGNELKKTDRIGGQILVAMAVYIGKTRLIDNFAMTVREASYVHNRIKRKNPSCYGNPGPT